MRGAARPTPLDGGWERPGRNPAIGSLIIVLVLGSIYFVAGNAAVIAVFAAKAIAGLARTGTVDFLGGAAGSADFAENLKAVYAANRVWILAVTAAFQYLVFLIAGLAVSKRSFSSDVAAYMGFRRVPVAGLFAGLACAALVLPVVDAISRLTDALFPVFSRYSSLNAELYRWNGPFEAAFVFFSISLTPAICEETVFRGLLQRGLQRRMGFPWSFVCSGIVFAVFHQSALSTPALIPVGILLGFLYWAFDSLWAGIAMHAAYNGAILLVSNEAVDLSFMMDGDYFRWPVWIAGAVGLAALCFLIGKRALAAKGGAPGDGGVAVPPQEAASAP